MARSKRMGGGSATPGRPAAVAAEPSVRPLVRLPSQVDVRLHTEARAIARRMSARIADQIPLGVPFRTTGYLRLLLRACREGVDALIRHLHDGRRPHPAELAALGAAGARQAEMGVPLEVLLAAYRLAAKMIWREVVDEATRVGELDPATMVAMTEQMLEYLDDISAAVGSAYLARREEVVRRRDRERDHLLRRLLAGDAGPEVLRLAVAAGLDLAPPYRVLAVSGAPDGFDSRLRSAAGRRSAAPLMVSEEPGSWVLLLDSSIDCRRLVGDALPSGGEPAGISLPAGREPAGDAQPARRERAGNALPTGRNPAGGRGATLAFGIGPVAVTLEEVPAAVARARRALAAGRRLDPCGHVFDDRDLGVLAILGEHPQEAAAFIERLLGGLLESRRADLLDTLEAVVSTPGLGDAAARLRVHRHTVVYRLERLRPLLAVDLDEPETRHRIWLALMLRRLLAAG